MHTCGIEPFVVAVLAQWTRASLNRTSSMGGFWSHPCGWANNVPGPSFVDDSRWINSRPVRCVRTALRVVKLGKIVSYGGTLAMGSVVGRVDPPADAAVAVEPIHPPAAGDGAMDPAAVVVPNEKAIGIGCVVSGCFWLRGGRSPWWEGGRAMAAEEGTSIKRGQTHRWTTTTHGTTQCHTLCVKTPILFWNRNLFEELYDAFVCGRSPHNPCQEW